MMSARHPLRRGMTGRTSVAAVRRVLRSSHPPVDLVGGLDQHRGAGRALGVGGPFRVGADSERAEDTPDQSSGVVADYDGND